MKSQIVRSATGRVLFFLCFLAFFLPGLGRTELAEAGEPLAPKLLARLEAAEPATIVCLGDSVTGVYYHTGGRRAYPEMLALALAQSHPRARLTVVNAGISGHSTVEALARLDRDVLAHQPHLVTVMFGLNDLVRVPRADYQANLAQIVDRCRASGAEVVLCTPNDVLENPGRPSAKLQDYCAAVAELGRDRQVPVCDIRAAYRGLHLADPAAWRGLFSDEIHPNMDGHRLNARVLAGELTGREGTLANVDPPRPALQKTLARIQAGQPVRILAMPPLDAAIRPALTRVHPEAVCEVRTWPVAGQTLAQIEQAAREVRKNPQLDLVLVALPPEATPGVDPTHDQISSFSWVLNHSLAFGRQEWDVVVAAPSIVERQLTGASAAREEFTRRMVRAQDVSLIARGDGEPELSTEAILTRWIQDDLGFLPVTQSRQTR